MGNLTNKYLLSPVFVIVAAVLWFVFSCSSDQGSPREIRGHSFTYEGIAHGAGAVHGERYCTSCHGKNLQGGSAAEPSCYTCHGKNWLDDDASVSSAPADHTVMNDGFHHHPDQMQPAASCASCHGSDLQGDRDLGLNTPSCFLCHEQKWP